MAQDRIVSFRTVEDYARKGQPFPKRPTRFDGQEAQSQRDIWQTAINIYHNVANLPGGKKNFRVEPIPQKEVTRSKTTVSRLIGEREATNIRLQFLAADI